MLEVCTRLKIDEKVKGLQEAVKSTWLEASQRLAGNGRCVIALATKSTDTLEENPYEALTFLGLTGLLNPPRQEVPQAIAAY